MYTGYLAGLVTLYFLFSTAASSVLYQDLHVGKVCTGSPQDNSKSGDDLDHYNYLKSQFANCTLVLGNIDVYSMATLTDVSLDFFNQISEVEGYVRVSGELPRGITKLPFRDLRIIRGKTLTAYSDNSEREYALFIHNTGSLTSLGFTNLREISRGHAYIGYNKGTCHAENVNWLDIFGGRRTQRANMTRHPEANCPPIGERCHPSCKKEYCWGPGANDCQELNRVNCASQCDYRCFGEDANQCCRPDCLAGCNGPNATQCWGCRQFYNNGTCTSQCPKAELYNGTSFKYYKNPNAKVSFGNLCLKKCPAGYYKFKEGCHKYRCPENYTNNEDDECVLCDGACPQECDWRSLGSDEWPTPAFLRKPENQNCTKIIGDVRLVSGAFDRPRNPDEYYGFDAISVDDLKVFENVREITGGLTFEPEHKLPNLTSLSIFKNLEIVGGSGVDDYSLILQSSHITSLQMPKLRKVSTAAIWLQNENLCYVTNVTFKGMLPDVIPRRFVAAVFQDPEKCRDLGMVCDPQCNGACVGPGPNQCVSTCIQGTDTCTRKCRNFEFEGTCVADCSGDDLYTNNTQCHRCHEQCRGPCKGPLDTDCTECENFKNGDRCVEVCPQPTYHFKGETTCRPCSGYCSYDQQFSCSGPEPTIGSGGCDACDRFMLYESGKSIESCLNSSVKCPSGYLTVNQWTKLSPQVRNVVNQIGFNEACKKCHPLCAECDGWADICTSCSKEAYELVKQDQSISRLACIYKKDCTSDKHYLNKTSEKCLECHNTCLGCYGSTDLECEDCRDFRLYLNGTERFQCVLSCPPYANYTWTIQSNKRECRDSPQPKNSPVQQNVLSDPAAAIGGSIAAVVVVLAATIIVVTYCCRQKTKHMEKAKEYEMRITGPGNVEPVEPTDAGPDLSRLRLIKESELKRTVIIGSGAFGTVFKGYYIPEHENVKVPVAIKVITEGTTPQQSTELLDEARVMASVDHPCCIKIVAVCMTAQMMLITPLMPAGCLLSYVKAKADELGSKILINWCAQIAKGMEHLQRCGIVHRDLAARNVLVQSETQVKITDFGLAKLLDVGEDYYKADSGKVPIKWMALESIQHRIFNHQTDVWSYGVTIWEILTFGQKPYDGVKARDIAIFLERGERLNQPTISTIDVYMIMIKCWMLDANTRPTFEDLSKEFTKMARDPGRYLVINGDQLKRNPTLKMNENWNFEELMMGEEDEYPEKRLIGADDYLSPSIASNYPRYENEDVIPPPFEKSLQLSSGDDLHSPHRYTSSPTLRQPDYPGDRLFVDTEQSDTYLEPVSSRAGTVARTPVDEDGYLQPQTTNSVYIDVLADEQTKVSPLKKKSKSKSSLADEACEPLLGADNSIYLSSKDHESEELANPTGALPDATNPIYMSNNNGSPVRKQSSMLPTDTKADYVNQDVVRAV